MYYLLRLIIELCLVYFGSVRNEIMPCRKNIRENSPSQRPVCIRQPGHDQKLAVRLVEEFTDPIKRPRAIHAEDTAGTGTVTVDVEGDYVYKK